MNNLSTEDDLILGFLIIAGIIFNSGKSWEELRQFTTRVLRSFGVGKRSYEDHVVTEAEYLLEYITNLRGESFDPTTAISNTVTN